MKFQCVGLLLVVSLQLICTDAFAQTGATRADTTLCADVFPCDDGGALLPEFSDPSGGCFERYRLECDQFVDYFALRKELEAEMGKLQTENFQLKYENRRLRRLVSRARK